jgi:hypothetical protein
LLVCFFCVVFLFFFLLTPLFPPHSPLPTHTAGSSAQASEIETLREEIANRDVAGALASIAAARQHLAAIEACATSGDVHRLLFDDADAADTARFAPGTNVAKEAMALVEQTADLRTVMAEQYAEHMGGEACGVQ